MKVHGIFFYIMKSFRRMAVASTIATYILIFIGGLVRVSGAGLGCPDWPKCFGGWIPPTSVDQLPPDIDPNLFNFTLAWIEYVNRLVGVTIGILILATAILAIKYFRHDKRILYSSLAAALFVAFQGWQGSRVVASGLKAHIVSLHMALAFIIISLLVYAAYRAYRLEKQELVLMSNGDEFTVPLISLWIVAISQIVLGTEVRGEIEMLRDQFPTLSDFTILDKTGWIPYFHSVLGLALGGGTWYVCSQVLRQIASSNRFLKNICWSLIGLVSVEMMIGMALFIFGIPALAQIIHLWIASLYIGLLLLLYAATKKI